MIVNGYKKEVLESHLSNEDVRFVTNKRYEKTNMVHTLFCAESEMDDDLLISYGDIIFSKNVLKQIIKKKNSFTVTVDKNWLDLWKIRMNNPLKDAETMKIDNNGNIIELGKKPKSYSEINGQYIGLLKISNSILPKVRSFYHRLDKSSNYDGKDFENMYMTSFIQLIIDAKIKVKADIISGGWLEFDSSKDIDAYNINNLNF
tara:strand:- start:440 stop:1048 length:609 start_codon:yes stop_codon:yes gene_type:complete